MIVGARLRARIRWCLFLVVLLLWPDSFLHAQQDAPLSLTAYQERLSAALFQLNNGADLETVQAKIAAIKQVKLPNGQVLDIVPLLADIDNVDDAHARLATVLGQLGQIDNDRTADRLAALDRASRRLDLTGLTLWERLWRWFNDLLDRILSPLRQTTRGSAVGQAIRAVTGWGFIAVGSLLVVILLSYWLRHFLGGILTDSIMRQYRTESGGVATTAAEARQQASAQAYSGDYRQAVRSLFLSALLHLRENDLLHYTDSQTNREMLANLGPDDPTRAHLEPVVETFDRIWYGIREPDEQTFSAYRQDVNALMAATDNG